jgi:hypothetical protein
MLKRILSVFALIGAMSLMTGCAVNRATANLSPGVDLTTAKTAYVVKQPKDDRGIDGLIAANLEKRGYVVTKGPEQNTPYKADVAVTYVDKWMWDITMYMIELTINVRDPQSGFPMAVGNSYHTSLTRKSPTEMVDEVLDNVFKAPKK